MIRGRPSSRYGFTLLELSIVLAIISLIAGVGMKMASDALKAADRITTQERLNTIKTAIDSFAKTYGYLPCPADRTQIVTNASFGVETRDGATHVTCVASGSGVSHSSNVWRGMVPLRTLGLPDYYAADAWGNKFDYAVSDTMVASLSSYGNQPAYIKIFYGTLSAPYALTTSQRSGATFTSVANNGSGVARVTMASVAPPTGTLVYVAGSVYKGSYTVTNISLYVIDLQGATYSATDSGTIGWQVSGENASYVVVSHGKDGRGAYPLNATSIAYGKLCNNNAGAASSPPPCTDNTMTTCIDIENCNDDDKFFDTDFNDGTQASQYFDDYIVWGSNDLSRAPLNNTLYTTCPTGTCENWCATCTVNYPGGGAAVPPASLTNPFLYKKVITSNSTTCSATCFWGGTTVTPSYIKGP